MRNSFEVMNYALCLISSLFCCREFLFLVKLGLRVFRGFVILEDWIFGRIEN